MSAVWCVQYTGPKVKAILVLVYLAPVLVLGDTISRWHGTVARSVLPMILTQCPWPTHIPTVCTDQFYWNLGEKKRLAIGKLMMMVLNGSEGCCSCFWRKAVQGLITKCRQIVLAKYTGVVIFFIWNKFVTSFCSVCIIWNHLLFREPKGIATGQRVGSVRLLWKSLGNYVDKVALKNVAMQFKIVSIYHQKDLNLSVIEECT